MKQLRVLTGRHAGTQLMLSASMYRIDSSEQADIQLTDWQSEPLVLELQETDSVVTVTFTSFSSLVPWFWKTTWNVTRAVAGTRLTTGDGWSVLSPTDTLVRP
jgi:hypothetical protein